MAAPFKKLSGQQMLDTVEILQKISLDLLKLEEYPNPHSISTGFIQVLHIVGGKEALKILQEKLRNTPALLD